MCEMGNLLGFVSILISVSLLKRIINSVITAFLLCTKHCTKHYGHKSLMWTISYHALLSIAVI